MDGGASKGILDPDRLFPLEPSVRGSRESSTPRSETCRLSPARTHRPALVRRGRAVPRSRAALRRARPLRLPHALLAGRGADRPRACRASTAARPRPTAAGSGGGSPRTTTCCGARRRGSGSTTPSRRSSASRPAVRGDGRRLLRPYRRLPGPAGVPAEGALPALRDRSDRDDRERARRPALAPDDPRVGLERQGRHRLPAGHCGRSGVSTGFAANVERFGASPVATPRLGTAISRRTGSAGGFRDFGATSTDHGHPTARTENLSQAEAAALSPGCSRDAARRRRPMPSAGRC